MKPAPRALVPLAAALRSGERAVADEAAATCDRIGRDDPGLLAFVPEPPPGRRERLAGQARALPARWPDPTDRPLLYGVPVGVKDVVRADGLPTRAGSAAPPEVLAGPQATVVDRMLAAGALVAGKTVTAEFAAMAPGPTRNPHDPAHTPGGSSSGSAAAVAAGMVTLGIGTQTIGSTIRPAAYCGIVGFKPTYGRIPIDGVIPNAPSLDTLGLFAADVAGVALAATALCDRWRPAAPAEPPGPLGVPAGPYLGRADAGALAAFDRQVARLRAAGWDVRDVPVMADFDDAVAVLHRINRYEMAAVHAGWYARFGERYRPETVAAIAEGRAVDDAQYRRALRDRDTFRERIVGATSDAGVAAWMAPSATGPAPRGLATTGDPIMALPWSLAGMPAVSLPAGTVAGLPVGLQVVGAPGADEPLLALAAALEGALAATS